MSGTAGSTSATVLTIAQVLYSLRDGQLPDSITPATIRNMIVSLAAIAGVTTVAGRSGAIQLTTADITDWSAATAGFNPRIISGTADPTPQTGAGTQAVLYSNTAAGTLWGNAGSSTTPSWVKLGQAVASPTPAPVPAPVPPPTPPSPVPSPVPTPTPPSPVPVPTPPSPTPSPVPTPTPPSPVPVPTPPSPTPSPVPSPTPPAGPVIIQHASANSASPDNTPVSTTLTLPQAVQSGTNVLLMVASGDTTSTLNLGSPWNKIVDINESTSGVRFSAYWAPSSIMPPVNNQCTLSISAGSMHLIETNAQSFDGAAGVGGYNGSTTFSATPATQSGSPALRFELIWGFASNDGGATGANGAPYSITGGGTQIVVEPGITGDGFTLLAQVPDGSTAAVAGKDTTVPVTYCGYVGVNSYMKAPAPVPAPVPPTPTPPPPTPSPTPSGGTGPAATSNFASADFTNGTTPAGVSGVTVYPQLFGASTGGMVSNYSDTTPFDICSNSTFQGLVRALNLPLLRINGGDWDGTNASNLAIFAANASKLLPSTCTLVIGAWDPNGNPATYKAVSDYWVANGTIPCNYWEVGNEYTSDANATAGPYTPGQQGFHQTNPNFKVGGPAFPGAYNGVISGLLGPNNASTLQFFSWHDYAYCIGSDPTPSDAQTCLAINAGNGGTLGAGLMGQAQTVTAGTYAANYPIILDEYNTECTAGNDLRAGTSMGVAALVSTVFNYAASANQNQAWAGIWDLYADGGAAYEMIDLQMNVWPQYYALQQLIAHAPGTMVSSSSGFGGVTCWATVNGGKFFVALVNSNSSPATGQVALSHWPVNGTGNGTVNVWTYPTNVGADYTQRGSPNTPGTMSTVGVTAGVTANITIPALSAVFLYP